MYIRHTCICTRMSINRLFDKHCPWYKYEPLVDFTEAAGGSCRTLCVIYSANKF